MSAELWFGIVSLAVGIVGAGFSLMASIIAYFVKRGEDVQDKNIDSLHREYAKLREDVDEIKQTLASYESHIGAGDARLGEIKTEIADHVRKEENIFWKKVEAMSEAQRIFSEAVLQRMAAVEAKMPNGELRELALAVARIEAAMQTVAQKADSAAQHVIDHDREAEDWKRRIVALESLGEVRSKKRSIRGEK